MRLTDFFKNSVFKSGESPEILFPHIELCRDRTAVIEGCRALNEYDENSVCFCCDGLNVRFTGDGLVISELDGDISYISGKIISVELFNA